MTVDNNKNTPYGYHGQVLRIDVSDASVDRIAIPESTLRRF